MKAEEFTIDPRSFQGPKDPPFLEGSYPEERIALCAHVVRDLARHPPVERHPRTGEILALPDPVWHRIRALPVRADGLTVEALLTRHGGIPYHELRWLIAQLLGARARRLKLLEEIPQLEAIERACAPDPVRKGAA